MTMNTDEMQAIHARLTSQDKKLDAIHNALVGDPSMGHRGLISRVESNETRIREHDNKLLRWGGIITGASLAASMLKDKLTGS